MQKQFDDFLNELSETNATLDYYTDFDKIITNVNKISLKLNQLNYLIGKDDLKTAISEVFNENPKAFEVLGILIAVRKKDKKKTIDLNGDVVLVQSYFNDANKVFEFIEETGLGGVFRNKNITNLVDYVFGVEVGLDSNARKNRGGSNMEKAVSKIFQKHNIFHKKEVYLTDYPEILSLGGDLKRVDFIIKTSVKTYLIEVNYYNGGGSKLNETARSYSDLAPKINQYDNFEFVWITDGRGWFSAKNKLQEAFNIIPSLYNLTSLDAFIKKVKEENPEVF
ncbi:restriction endonuclease [Pseudalgibacter alginicilyticus]|uniref:Type-2 restriction enzyme n=1 Tax=Pseudalgibacter alginicilyticus TaxID=1736674 RepID=A0A0P0CDH6_9FLAO|nr:type II restriction endonuclease [Pseudalgibacter alginicilyticus]ALJ03970.1 restriction endonuclease [Pseudalgibacter alginicilyticus]